MNTTRSIRRLADQVVSDSLDTAFNQVFATAVAQEPQGHWRAGTAVKAYLQAVRARLEWMERHS